MKKTIGIVTTKYGRIAGVEAKEEKYEGLTYFKGIPYAAPPIGELRWKPPVDPKPWEDIRQCSEYSSMARQDMGTGPSFEPWATDFYYMGHPKNDEDCLYLNVTTGASSPEEKRPVFMWFHGGGLNTGYSFEIEFDNSELARKGIVVVTVGQRLNVFGYLCCKQLSAEQGGKSGNYGFMDEVKALDWVYENIAAFGGDPENITIGGQSGGTMKSGSLASSPYQKNRVKRVINQSGLCWLRKFSTIQEAEERAEEYFKAIGIDPNCSVEDLRAMDSSVFYRPLPPMDFSNPVGPRMPGDMVYDSDYVEFQNMQDAIDKYAGNCDYLTGCNWGESAMKKGFSIGGAKAISKKDFYEMARYILGNLYEKYDFENLVQVTDETADKTSRWLSAKGLSGGFGCGYLTRHFGAYRAKTNPSSKTFTYIFSHVPPTRPEDNGTERDYDFLLAWHSSELWYTFSSLRNNVPPARPWTELDFTLADQISSYWANFIKSGDPNGDGLPEWPASDASFAWMELGDKLIAHHGLEDKIDQMIQEYTKLNFNVPEL